MTRSRERRYEVIVREVDGAAFDDSDAVALYQSGMTLEDLAEKYGLSPMTVWRRLKALGVEMRPRGRNRKE